MTNKKEWFDWNSKDLQNIHKQMQIFKVMLNSLEDNGKCRDVFHELAEALFGDQLR